VRPRTKAKAKVRRLAKAAVDAQPKRRPPAEPSSSAGGRPQAATKRARRARRSSQKRTPVRKPIRQAAPKESSGRGKGRKSRHPEAVRSRRRRREERGIRDQLAFERAERAEIRRERERERRSGQPPDLRRLAIGWLEEIRNICAGVFPCSLDITHAEAGATTPWLVVGRFDAGEPIGYVELAEALSLVRDDLVLETTIDPRRLSQIRVVYRDPQGQQYEGDSIVSKTGAWEFIVSDLVGELIGSGTDDEDALAVRYAETAVPTFYVYFSAALVDYATASAWQRVRFG
jgi:hypothetical protein